MGSNTNSTFISVPVQGCIQLSSVKTTGDFQQSNFCGGSIGAASACSIQVTFAPTSDGLRTGSLNFDFGTSSPAQTVTLTGTGFQPQLPTSPGGLTFAPQTLQTTSAAQNVTTLGGFTPPLQVNGIWISGDFSQTNNCSQFNFGSNCVFSIVFTPTAAGLRTGSLIINTNQGVANVPLSGTGLNSASATLTPFSLVFPDQLVNTLSAAQPVTLSNTGVTSFVPGVITISGDFAADSSQCQVPLAPGSSCVYAITFKPSAIGTRTGIFTVQTDAGPLSVNLSGNGVLPQASVSPQSVAFANQVVQTSSAAQAVTLTSVGGTTLVVTSIATTGDFAQTNGCGVSLTPGATCVINVTFTPSAVGSRSGTLSILTNGGNLSLPLSGTGVNALAGIAPAVLAFGSQILNTASRSQTLTLTAGINALQIASISASGDFAQTNTCGVSLASGASCTVQVTFTPTAEGQRSGILTVSSNEGLLSVPLSGTGLARAQNTIYVPVDQPTIQAAIAAAVNGQTVQVLPGTYFEHIDFLGKAITVSSTDGASATTIDGSTTGTVVTFKTGEGPASVLSGFTITHGTSTFEGAGILISTASPTIQNNTITANQGCQGIGIGIGFGSPIIQNNTISNNTQVTCSGGNGGGISVRGASTPQIIGNIITGNQLRLGGAGGGIALNAASATIIGNTIQHNSVFNDGGGISTVNASSPNIIQNLITDNSANGNGGGIYWLVSIGSRGPFVVNNTVANNTAASGSATFWDGFAANVEVSNNIFAGLAGQAALNCSTTSPILSGNDAFSSGAAGYAGTCVNAAGANGNISLDPQFVDTANGNYRVQPTSPAIDAGSNSAPNLPAVDLDGNPRIAFGNASTCSGAVDEGAYEFALTTVPAATLSPASFDFGIQPDGTTSAAAAFTVSATQGCVPVTSVTTTGDFTQTNNCSSVLATGSSCVVQVSFTPSLTGPRTGTLSVTANGTTLTSNLTGQGGAAIATVAPGALDFGSQLVGSTSAAQQITLTNTGNLALNISGISATGDFAQSNTCGVSLAPGAACVISVTFTPTARLARTGSLVIQSNSSPQPASVALTGTGIAPVPVFSPASVNFASQRVGTSGTQTITLTNSPGTPRSTTAASPSPAAQRLARPIAVRLRWRRARVAPWRSHSRPRHAGCSQQPSA